MEEEEKKDDDDDDDDARALSHEKAVSEEVGAINLLSSLIGNIPFPIF